MKINSNFNSFKEVYSLILIDNISINRAIIHRLDNQIENGLEKSDFTLDLNEDIRSVLATHSSSSLNDKKIRYAKFNNPNDNFVYKLTTNYLSGESDFVKYSHSIADSLYHNMNNKSISPGDLVIVDSNIDGEQYIVILKLDYKDQYLSDVVTDKLNNTVSDKQDKTLFKRR